MASITSAGVGSGLDVAGLVTQLVAAERQAPAARLSSAQTRTQTQLSAFGTFRSALASLQDAAKALRDGGVSKLAATSGDGDLIKATITTDSQAAAASYSVEVLQLAKAHKLASDPYASSSTVVGVGKLTLGSGGDNFSVDIDLSNNTLAGIRDAINGASDNPGIRAALLNTVDGVRLTLSAPTTGADAAITVQASTVLDLPILPPGTGLDALSYVTGNQQLNQLEPAQNAQIKIDTYTFESQNNDFEDAVEGLRFSAAKAQPGTTVSITVGQDQAAGKSAVENFVQRYNALNATVATLARYNATTREAGPLLGDSTLRGLAQQVRIAASSSYGSGSYTHVSQLGITTNADGSLKLDASKLQTALAADPAAVEALLGEDGVGGRLFELADPYLVSGGRIQARQDAANTRLKDISKQQDALDLRMERIQARYSAQFGALDTLIAQMKTTSSYLTQQLANLPSYSD